MWRKESLSNCKSDAKESLWFRTIVSDISLNLALTLFRTHLVSTSSLPGLGIILHGLKKDDKPVTTQKEIAFKVIIYKILLTNVSNNNKSIKYKYETFLLLTLLDNYHNIMKVSIDDRFMYNREMKIYVNKYIYSMIFLADKIKSEFIR